MHTFNLMETAGNSRNKEDMPVKYLPIKYTFSFSSSKYLNQIFLYATAAVDMKSHPSPTRTRM